MGQENYTSAYFVACAELHHLDFIAGNFTRSAKLLYEKENGSQYSQSFHLLVSMAFEIFPKIIIGCEICLLHQSDVVMTVDEIRAEIVSEHRKLGHNLKKLFEKYPDLMQALEIETIMRVPDNPHKEWFVNEYRFKIKGCRFLLSVKDVEAVRYGSFSQNRDVVMDSTGDKEILGLLLKLQEFVHKKKLETIQKMRKTTL